VSVEGGVLDIRVDIFSIGDIGEEMSRRVRPVVLKDVGGDGDGVIVDSVEWGKIIPWGGLVLVVNWVDIMGGQVRGG
jgi:hypothetical protein